MQIRRKQIVVFFTLILVAFIFYALAISKQPQADDNSLHIANITDYKTDTVKKTTKKSSTTLRDSIVDYAHILLGTPYVSAGCSTDGFDCSGFVYFVFKHFNIDVPRSSALYKSFGKDVSISHVQKGDVLVFLSPSRNEIGHIGIVTEPNGMETKFIHSTSGKAMQVVVSSLKNEGYRKRFVKAVNVLEK
jgi:cell wall-associated NlpC family hydrolase